MKKNAGSALTSVIVVFLLVAMIGMPLLSMVVHNYQLREYDSGIKEAEYKNEIVMDRIATIIKNATSRSLLILDEIGRGTSTFDGMSIARAVLEYVADKRKLGAKTLFATHYHELTEMENEIKGIRNYNIAVKKRGDDITFLRRIVRGGADESYGIEVAKLAGIPETVTNRAKQILQKTIEEGVTVTKTVREDDLQFPISFGSNNEIIEELKAIDVNILTPIESMSILSELSKKAKEL